MDNIQNDPSDPYKHNFKRVPEVGDLIVIDRDPSMLTSPIEGKFCLVVRVGGILNRIYFLCEGRELSRNPSIIRFRIIE